VQLIKIVSSLSELEELNIKLAQLLDVNTINPKYDVDNFNETLILNLRDLILSQPQAFTQFMYKIDLNESQLHEIMSKGTGYEVAKQVYCLIILQLNKQRLWREKIKNQGNSLEGL